MAPHLTANLTLNTTSPTDDAPVHLVYPTQPVSVLIPESGDLEPIYTDRLVLRPVPLHDPNSDAFKTVAEGEFRMRRREDVARWLRSSIPHKSIEETVSSLNAKIFSTPDASGVIGKHRHLYFFIMSRDEHAEKDIIGLVGINSLHPAPSVGYALHPDAWGKGYATEAVRGVVDAWWALPRVQLEVSGSDSEKERLFAITQRANVGSFKVLQKAGF
ncbi:hypothetical protein BDV12DRAFT_11863 [Aspergillus spectabilis]